ncbi:hypothetical protein ACH3XW_11025 [Acanthocheilonema viteae]
MLLRDYGVNRSEPVHSSKYSRINSPRNKKKVGKILSEKRAELFINYDSLRKKKIDEKITNSLAEHIITKCSTFKNAN